MLYLPNFLIVGPSGTGKTSSLAQLPKGAETVILDLERKGLPFRGKFENHKAIEDLTMFEREFTTALNSTCRYIIIDSLTKWLELKLAACRKACQGYDIYTQYNTGIRMLLEKCKSTKQFIILTAIDEFLQVQSPNGSSTTARRVAVQGKEWEGKVEKEFLCVLFTNINVAAGGKTEYKFITNTDGICSAKTPRDMFKDAKIDNDLALVLKTAEEYYK